MNQIKKDAIIMKEALLRSDLREFSDILGTSPEAKNLTGKGISNSDIDRFFEIALGAGAYVGKISGAGGGGFMFFTVEPNRRPEVLRAAKEEPGIVTTFALTDRGALAWRV